MSIDNPKKELERLTKFGKNQDFARHSLDMEKTDHLGTIAENTKSLGKVGSFVQHFLDEVTPKKGIDYLPQEEMDSIKKELTPIYKKDYLTDDEIEKIKQEITPKKGEHYNDGQDGHTPTEEELLNIIMPLIPEPIPGEPGLNADEDKIIQSVLSKIPKPKDGKNPSVQEVVKATLSHLQNLKGNDRPSLKMFREADDLIGTVSLHKNMMRNMPKSLIEGDQRWGGHGGSSSGGGFTILPTTVVPNGSTQVFTFLTATAQPSLICIDGAFTPAIDNLGATQWTWVQATQTATLINNAPTSNIFAVQ